MTPNLSSRLRRAACSALLLVCTLGSTDAQVDREGVNIPNFWDRKRKIERPDLSQIKQIRFLTESDYPPFHFTGPDGQLMGFEVDIARAICTELKVECSIQPRRWDGLPDALIRGQGDAIIASMRITSDSRKRFAFSTSYYRTPARFIAFKDKSGGDASAAAMAGRKIAVARGSTHEAYLKTFFPAAIIVAEASTQAVLDAVRNGSVDAGFVDGVAGALWLNGELSAGCCAFVGGPFTESRYFGEGAGIALRRDNPRLLQAIDWALYRMAADGTYTTLYLKYFPIGFY